MIRKIPNNNLPLDIKAAIREAGFNGRSYDAKLIENLEAVATLSTEKAAEAQAICVDIDVDTICGTREECHKQLDVLIDKAQAEVKLSYESPDFYMYEFQVLSYGYDITDEQICVHFRCLESEHTLGERLRRIGAANYVLDKKDELSKLALRLDSENAKRAEFNKKMQALKDEYGME